MSIVETVVDDSFIDSMSSFLVKPVGVGLLEACSMNVCLFAKYMLGIDLYAWQIDFLSRIMSSINGFSSNREFAAITSRQIGKTTSVAILTLWSAVFNKVPCDKGYNSKIVVVSASDQQSKDLITKIRDMMFIGDAFMKDNHDYDYFFTSLLDKTNSNNSSFISFLPSHPSVSNTPLLKDSVLGSQIRCFPPTSKVLGSTASLLFIDEVGMSEKITDKFIDEQLSQVGDKFNAIRIYTSTPWLLSGFFYRIIDPDDVYEDSGVDKVMFTIDSIKLEDPKQWDTVMNRINRMNSDGKIDEVQRAYYCRFAKGDSSFFDPFMVDNIFSDKDMVLVDSYYSYPCDLGVDFGGFGANAISRTVLTISMLDKEGFINRIYHKFYDVGKDDNIINDIEELYSLYNIQRIIPDDCPAAQYLIPQMIKKGWNVTPMNYKSDKVKKYGAFRAMVNKGMIRSYKDTDLLIEMKALEVSQGQRSMLIRHASGYRDDLIDSFLQSCYHFLTDEAKIRYIDVDEIMPVNRSIKNSGSYDFGW